MLKAMWNSVRQMWAEPAATSPSTGVRWSDRVLALVVIVAVAVESFLRFDPGWWPVTLGVGVALAVAVLVRRVRCLSAVILAVGAMLVVDIGTAVLHAPPLILYSGAVLLVLIYSLFRWGAGRDITLGMGVVALEFTVSTITDFTGAEDAIGGAAVILFAAATGAAIRYRMMARHQLVEHVKLQEREHLARELHDSVAHHVSAIAVQAQAGLVLARTADPAVIDTFETIDQEAAKTLEGMRAMVGILRDGNRPSTNPAQYQLSDIGNLATGSSDSSRVTVEMSGDLTGLPLGVEAALFRVAQEAVTNATRHARHATLVAISVIGSETDVHLTILDDGDRTTPPKTPGFGLIGMTERVALLGGTVEAGPNPDRGWRVTATLPRPQRRTP